MEAIWFVSKVYMAWYDQIFWIIILLKYHTMAIFKFYGRIHQI